MNVENNEIRIKVPDDVVFILKTIRSAGFEACIVGGCVRDSLMGREPKDWDITTSALPEQVKSLFYNTVDSGIEHGTVMVILHGKGYEVTTYRVDGKYSDARHPDSVSFTPSLGEDLKRRDFTINAFACTPDDVYSDLGIKVILGSGTNEDIPGVVVDLFGGMKDLNEGLVRAVGDPRKRFSEDALRIMRAVRFAAQLSFRIEGATQDAIAEFGPKLALVSRERIRVEFEKTLFSPNPAFVNKYRELGLSRYIVPEVYEKCFDCRAEAVYEKICLPAKRGVFTDNEDSALEESFSCKEKAKEYLLLAAFFRRLSYKECRTVMRKMTFDNCSRDIVSGIISNADDDLFLTSETSRQLRCRIKRKMRDVGKELFELLIFFKISESDGEAFNLVSNIYNVYKDIINSGEPYCISMLALNGKDLTDAGVKAGPEVGETLSRLLEKVIEDPTLNTRERLLLHI